MYVEMFFCQLCAVFNFVAVIIGLFRADIYYLQPFADQNHTTLCGKSPWQPEMQLLPPILAPNLTKFLKCVCKNKKNNHYNNKVGTNLAKKHLYVHTRPATKLTTCFIDNWVTVACEGFVAVKADHVFLMLFCGIKFWILCSMTFSVYLRLRHEVA